MMSVLPGVGLFVPKRRIIKPEPAFLTSRQSNGNSFSTVSFGVEHPKRVIALVMGTLNGRLASACSIGGGSATLAKTQVGGDLGNMVVQIFYRALATGTSGTVSFTKTTDNTLISVYAIYPDDPAPTATAGSGSSANTVNLSIATPDKGVLLFGMQDRSNGPFTGSWSGTGTPVEDVDAANGARRFGAWHLFGTIAETGTISVNHPNAGDDTATAAATWGK